jgi:glycosyltransferase involved in cell wall biosynthesis
MNVLFLTLSSFKSISDSGIYTDLMRKITQHGHFVYVVAPIERRLNRASALHDEQNCKILSVRTLNIQKTNILEKVIGTLLIEFQFKSAIDRFLQSIKFDLVIYSTPPITFVRVVKYIKFRDNAKTYLLLKDIFPQNAVDLKLIRNGSIIHRYFRRKELELYSLSDNIGCMSPANLSYLFKHNPMLDKKKVHVNPNSIEISERRFFSVSEKLQIRAEFSIPEDVTIFIYGGNLGKPQGLSFLIDIIEFYLNSRDVYFVLVGSGTEFDLIFDWVSIHKPTNVLLLQFLPKQKYENLLVIADVGLIFLDPRFTIPNFPSRLLSYLEFSIPIIAATDLNTDIGKIAQEHKFGLWCKSGDINSFCNLVDQLKRDNKLRLIMGENGNQFLRNNYTVDKSYSLIIDN